MASPHFTLNSQLVCFLEFLSKMTNWESHFLLKSATWAHWSSLRAREWKCKLAFWVWAVQWNSAVVFGVSFCSVSLCLFEFVRACRDLWSHVYLVTDLHSNASPIQTRGPGLASELVFCSSDEVKMHECDCQTFFKYFFANRLRDSVARWDRMWWNKLQMCILLHGGPGIQVNINTCG